MSTIQSLGIISKNTVKRLRYAAGTYVNGLYVRPDPIENTINASVQPPNRLGSARIKQELGGQRLEDWVVVICKPDTLRTVRESEGILADRIVHKGKTYEVRNINSWVSGQVLEHDSAFCILIDETGTDDVLPVGP